jgi:integrase
VGNLTPAQARDIAEELAGHVAHGIDIHTQKKATRIEAEKARVRVLRGFLEHKYRPWVLAERKTGDETLRRIQYNFRDLLDKPLGELNHWVAEKWRSEQLKSGKSKATVNRDIAALRAALSKAVEWGLIDSHPLAKLKPIRGDRLTKVRYLSQDEEERLRGALAARDDKLKAGRASANAWRRARDYTLYPDLKRLRLCRSSNLDGGALAQHGTSPRRGLQPDLELCQLSDEDLNGGGCDRQERPDSPYSVER